MIFFKNIYLPHFWHCYALNVFSIWIGTLINLRLSYLLKKFQDKKCIKENLQKKHVIFVWLFVEDIKISNIFYKNKTSKAVHGL